MTENEVLESAFAMPMASPYYPRGPYRFIDREFLIIIYRSDPEILSRIVPAPLELAEPMVKFEFIRMPDSAGFGDYCEAGQIIPVTFKGESGGYQYGMYLNNHSPIAGGRELWGFPKKLGEPDLKVNKDHLIGTLDYYGIRIATATMGYKHRAMDSDKVRASLSRTPAFLLKVIPHVDGTPRICELVRTTLADVAVKGAWEGPGSLLALNPHALAPVTDLPVLEVVSAQHILTDLTLPYGTVAHDYLVQ